MSKITELAAGRLPNSTGDLIGGLAEPDGMPASVIIHWPTHGTVLEPQAFPTAAETATRVFAAAVEQLTRIAARRPR